VSYTEEFRVVAPEGGGWITPRNLMGHRIAVTKVHSIDEEPDPLNQGRTRQVATVDYVDIDDGAGGILKRRNKVDKLGIVNKLTVGSRDIVLGRIGQGDAKEGKNAPFLLDRATPEDIAEFTDTWLPAHLHELRGDTSTPPTPAPTRIPAPAAPAAPAPAPAPTPGNAPATAFAPTPADQTGGLSPEAQAALAGMIARGEIPGLTMPQ